MDTKITTDGHGVVTAASLLTTPYKVNFLKHVYAPNREPDFDGGLIQFWDTADGIIARGSRLAGAFGESVFYVNNCKYEPGRREMRVLFVPWSRITPRRARNKSMIYLDQDVQASLVKKRAFTAYWKAIKHYRVYSAKKFSVRLSDSKTAEYAMTRGPIYKEGGYMWVLCKTQVSQHFYFKRLMPEENDKMIKICAEDMIKQYIGELNG